MKATLIPALLITLVVGLLPEPCRAEGVVVQWEKRYNGPGNNQDRPSGVAVDHDGNVIVTGRSVSWVRNVRWEYVDYYTAKYAATDGALVWERRHDGPLNRFDEAAAVALDSAGNVIVTGHSDLTTSGGLHSSDFYTAKYAAADGALLWDKSYNGPADSYDSAVAMAVDSVGNVIVTGHSRGVPFDSESYDYYTAKYAASDGALLWENRFNGTSNGYDQPRGLALDGEGNVIVTGSSENAVGGHNLLTIKYAAENGALLWQRRSTGLYSDGWPVCVALDGTGNAIVSGTFTIKSINNKYTAKYASESGALLWERYSGRGIVGGMDIDSSGNIINIGVRSISDVSGAWYIEKYEAENGQLIWERRLFGDVGVMDLALDAVGNPVVAGLGYDTLGNVTGFKALKYSGSTGSLLWEKHDGAAASGDGALGLTADGFVVAGAVGIYPFVGPQEWESSLDFFTIKYSLVDEDLDDDGLQDSWEITHFGNTGAQGALDDSDRDGAVELLELAFGTDPRQPGSVAGAEVIVEDGYLTMSIAKQPCVIYLVETGSALDGDFSAASTTVLNETGTTLKVRDNVLVGTQPSRFLRVRVMAAP